MSGRTGWALQSLQIGGSWSMVQFERRCELVSRRKHHCWSPRITKCLNAVLEHPKDHRVATEIGMNPQSLGGKGQPARS